MVGSLITLAVAFLVAITFSDDSLIGAVGQDAGVVSETFRQVIQLLGAGVFDDGPLGAGPARAAPAVFVLVPIGACALAARVQVGRTAHVGRRARLAFAAAAGLPFALLMVFAALAGGQSDEVEPSLGSTFLLGLLWGSIGALLGTWGSVRKRVASPSGPRAEAAAPALEVVRAALRPLALVLAVAAVVGLFGWLVQTARGVGNTATDPSPPLALVGNALYFVEHGVHLAELGAGVRFRNPGLGALGLPFPVEDPSDLAPENSGFRLFAYREVVPPALFVPALLVLIALPVLGALYAGFAVARRREAGEPGVGAAWGALVGPLWAVTMVILTAFVSKRLFGDPSAASVLATFLLGGALLGALGGLLAGPSGRAAEPSGGASAGGARTPPGAAAAPAGVPGAPPASATATGAGSSPPTGGPPPDWYPDPGGVARLRYWDGTNWTEHTSG